MQAGILQWPVKPSRMSHAGMLLQNLLLRMSLKSEPDDKQSKHTHNCTTLSMPIQSTQRTHKNTMWVSACLCLVPALSEEPDGPRLLSSVSGFPEEENKDLGCNARHQEEAATDWSWSQIKPYIWSARGLCQPTSPFGTWWRARPSALWMICYGTIHGWIFCCQMQALQVIAFAFGRRWDVVEASTIIVRPVCEMQRPVLGLKKQRPV